ncbi:MAG: lysophospholipid acyltransferase family protein [Myxococcota bacterium]
MRFLRWTWRVRFIDRHLFDDATKGGASVFAFWHGEQLPMIPVHAGSKVAGMASRSQDGAFLAEVIGAFGYTVIRGSSSRGGLAAFRSALRALQADVSPALALDGPRGPRHQAHMGAVSLAAHSGRPIVFAVSHAWPAVHLRSWDRFQIPLPWARIRIAYGEIPAPQNDRASIEAANTVLVKQMRGLHDSLRTSASLSPSHFSGD